MNYLKREFFKMGMYDYFGDVQLKVGDCCMNNYKIGDAVPIADGVYVGYEGVVVIQTGLFIAFHPKLKDKWGNEIDMENTMKLNNPLYKVLLDGGFERLDDET